jgi:hypothetical protein
MTTNKKTVFTNDEARAVAPALFAKPLFRMRLVEPTKTQYGYPLIDVIALLPPTLKEQESKHAFPYYVCLALGSGGTWNDIQISDGDGHCDIGEAYEVVS